MTTNLELSFEGTLTIELNGSVLVIAPNNKHVLKLIVNNNLTSTTSEQVQQQGEAGFKRPSNNNNRGRGRGTRGTRGTRSNQGTSTASPQQVAKIQDQQATTPSNTTSEGAAQQKPKRQRKPRQPKPQEEQQEGTTPTPSTTQQEGAIEGVKKTKRQRKARQLNEQNGEQVKGASKQQTSTSIEGTQKPKRQHKPATTSSSGTTSTPVASTTEEGAKPKKQRKPTHFVAVRIHSPQMINDIVKWQQSVLSEHYSHSQDYDLKDYLIKEERMHFTLFVLTLDSQDDIENCKTVFKSCQDELKDIVKNNLEGEKFSFKLSGVHTFEDKKRKMGQVVFTVPEYNHENGKQTFLEISQYINDQLKEKGLTVGEIQTEIHCSLAKTTKVRKNNSPKAFPEYVYRHQKDTVFGDENGEEITEVVLCRMNGPGVGFYRTEETVLIQSVKDKPQQLEETVKDDILQ